MFSTFKTVKVLPANEKLIFPWQHSVLTYFGNHLFATLSQTS